VQKTVAAEIADEAAQARDEPPILEPAGAVFAVAIHEGSPSAVLDAP
jgi:hypothetical protein